MKRVIFILFLLCFVPSVEAKPLVSDIDQYNFTDNSFIKSGSNYVLNITSGYVRCNASTGGLALEDLTSWNEQNGSPDELTVVNSTYMEYDGYMRYSYDNWVIRDYDVGASFVNRFSVYVDAITVSSRTIRGIFAVYHRDSVADNIIGYRDGNEEIFYLYLRSYNDNTKWQLGTNAYEDGVAGGSDTSIDLSVDTWYYLELERDNYNVTVDIYDDYGFTNLIDSININLWTAWSGNYNMSYIQLMSNMGYATAESSTVYMKDVSIFSGLSNYLDAVIYSNDLVNDVANYVMFDTVINNYTSVNVYGSNDNSSWVSLLNITNTGREYCEVYNTSWSDMYLKVVLNTTGIYTPYVNQVNVVYVTDLGYSIGIVLLMVAVSVIIGMVLTYE